MSVYSKRSVDYLDTCNGKLIELGYEVLKIHDHSVEEGFRGEEDQNGYYEEGLSQVKWPYSKHNVIPSKAVHFKPYPIEWDEVLLMDWILTGNNIDKKRLQKAFREYSKLYFFAGIVKAKAIELGMFVRWGGDWDGDYDFNDQTFHDLLHWEIR